MKHTKIKKLIKMLKHVNRDDVCSGMSHSNICCNIICEDCIFDTDESYNDLIKELEELI